MRRTLAFIVIGMAGWLTLQAGAAEAPVVDTAMQMVKADQSADALALLKGHLASHPDDSEARVRYGAILSWEKQLDEARRQLEMVLAAKPDHYDAISALINVEMWSDRPARAEELARRGLERHPEDTDFMYKLARAQRAQARTAEAKTTVRRLLLISPDRQDAVRLKEDLDEESMMWESQVSTSQEFFNDGRAHWSEWSTDLKRRTSHGSVIARFTRADRWAEVGHMVEMDVYHSLREGTQLYLNGGWSYDAVVHPRSRFGAEVFQSLPAGFQFSAGYRRLNFSGPVNIYTGSLIKYYGNWMFTGRGFFTPDTTGTSVTVRAGARRYFRNADTYVGVWASHGASPTEIRNAEDLMILHATAFQGELSKVLNRRVTLRARAGVAREQMTYNPNLLHMLLDLGLYYKF